MWSGVQWLLWSQSFLTVIQIYTHVDMQQQTHVCCCISQRGSGVITGEQMETCAWHSPGTLSPPRLLKTMLQFYLFFCLNSAEMMAEGKQRGQPRRPVESVWASLHDHPICQGPGVGLGFWWQSFSKDTDCLVDPGGTWLTDGDKNPLPSMMNATL